MKDLTIKRALIYVIALSILVAAAVSCGLFSKKELNVENKGLLRLLDAFGQKNLNQSPFIGLIEHFPMVEEQFASDDAVLVRELSTSREKVWALTTSRSVLGKDESRKPDEMEIWLADKKINYLGQSEPGDVAWQWVKTRQEIDIRFDQEYNRGLKCLVLDEDEFFSFDRFFPDAPVVIEIRARRNWHPLHLNVSLDGELLDSLPVSRVMTNFQIQIPQTPGTHAVSVKPEIKQRLSEERSTPPRLLIYWVKVITKNDVVMFFVPQSRQADFSQSPIRTRYYSELNSEKELNPYAYLYRIKHDFTLDPYSQPDNPEKLKKQLTLENLTLDVLMAPPLSRYEFQIKIPEKGRLEFGTGIFSYREDSQQKEVQFLITAKHNGISQTLFDKKIRLKDRMLREQLEFETIDLSQYAGKSIQLALITQSPSAGEDAQPENPAFSFWVNPVMYLPEKDSLKVILVSLDTLRADHLGAYGYTRDTSPYLDQLTQDSVLFENAYAQSSWTLPSHMSMLFSLNTASHQVYFNDQKIDSSIPSLASYLRETGYLTQAITGGGYVSSIFGFSKGFDWYEEPVGGQRAALRDDEAAYLFEKTSRWLQANKDKKFFLFLHTFQTHGPYRCPSPWNESFLAPSAEWEELALRNFLDNRGDDHNFTDNQVQNIIDLYDGEIKYTDEVLIKPLIESLKELGIYDDTLLIITSDHGEEFQDHGGWLHGRTLYNELIKVPLIIKLPASRNKGTRIPSVVRLIDIMPTVLETAGIPYDGIDGKSLLGPIARGKAHDRIFISDLAHKNTPVPCPALSSTNRGHIKFIIDHSEDGIKSIETYDLTADPDEQKNIFQEVQAMRDEVVQFLADYYAEKKKLDRSIERIQMGKELEEKLKALGYLR
jgi:arylsulfatase A-like enzyme